eukprot:8442054-Alexandrium_andersonii.AAC.1
MQFRTVPRNSQSSQFPRVLARLRKPCRISALPAKPCNSLQVTDALMNCRSSRSSVLPVKRGSTG